MPTKECRICLRREEDCVSLFTKRRGTKLAEIIRFCAKVEISEDDGLPGDACPRCVDEALNAYLFVNKCRRSDAELRTAQALTKDTLDGDETTSEVNNLVERDIAPNATSLIGDCIEDEFAVENIIEDFTSGPVSVQQETEQGVIPTNESELKKESKIEDEQNNQHPEQEQKVLYTVEIKQENTRDDSENSAEDVEEDFLIEYLDDNSNLSRDEQIVSDHGTDCGEIELPHLEVSSSEIDQHFSCCGIRCKAFFNSQTELTDHSRNVHLPYRSLECSEKPFECEQCFARFSTDKSLAMHIENPPLISKQHGSPTIISMKNCPNRICCGCHESFENEQELRAHSEFQHSIRKSAFDETKPFQCDVCYKLFRTVESLRIHRRFAYRPKNFPCNSCDRAFDTRSKLITHELVHTDQRNFPCDKCHKSFKKENDLRGHLLLHNEKKEVCPVCASRFHRRSNLKMHMRKHQDTFFYSCPDCPRQFKNNSHLKEHYKVHSKQTPYACNYCDRSFSYYSDRKRHEMTHTGNYPFVCEWCTKKFARKPTYEKHRDICQDRFLPG